MLIEKNTFMHARGKGDSCGIHIDYNCRDVVVQYNLYISDSVLPANLPYRDAKPFFGDAVFKNPGGSEATDYIPRNRKLIKDQGIEIPALKGDPTGIRIGLKVETDFLGQPISGKPDLGAIEIN